MSIVVARDISRVEYLVREVAVRLTEILVVKRLDGGILVRAPELHSRVRLIDRLRTQRADVGVVADICALDGLTAAVDAAARAGHDLDELVVRRAVAHLFHEFARVAEPARDRHFDDLPLRGPP